MKIKCDYCDSWINDFDETCPNCGATNSHYVRQSDKVPKTIEELKAWAKAMNLPLADMRTFIGEDSEVRRPSVFTKTRTTALLWFTKTKPMAAVRSATRAATKLMR